MWCLIVFSKFGPKYRYKPHNKEHGSVYFLVARKTNLGTKCSIGYSLLSLCILYTMALSSEAMSSKPNNCNFFLFLASYTFQPDDHHQIYYVHLENYNNE